MRKRQREDRGEKGTERLARVKDHVIRDSQRVSYQLILKTSLQGQFIPVLFEETEAWIN